MKIEVELPEDELPRFEAWKEMIDKEQIERQRASMDPEDFSMLTCDGKYPYSGAIGGALTWKITFTSIGPCVTAVYWGEEFSFDMNW